MSEEGAVRFEIVEEGIGRLTFDRQAKLNALSTQMIDGLERGLDHAATDRSVRVLILTGAGDRAFVAGADISEYRGRRTEEFGAYQKKSRRVFDKLAGLSKPTIAAVNGYALGGGFEIALCCDVIICSESARFGLPEGRLGLCPGGGGTQRLTRLVGRIAALDVLLTARSLAGERAYQLGIASDLHVDNDLAEAAIGKARAMFNISPAALATMKRLVRAGADLPLAEAQTLEQEQLFDLYVTDDAQEGIDAFLDKRKPRFVGERHHDVRTWPERGSE